MFELHFDLDPGSKTPLYLQISETLAAMIRRGQIPAGSRLPSKRSLMGTLGVSQSTVEAALAVLCAEGYAESRARSGYYAAQTSPSGGGGFAADKDGRGLPASERSAPEDPFRPSGPPPPEGEAKVLPYPLSTGAVDTGIFPYAAWAKLTRETLLEPGLLDRGHRQGEPELRRQLQEFLWESRGVRCRADQILVGAGQEYLLGQILRLLEPGSTLGLEDPGYHATWRAAETAGLRPVPVPVDRFGVDVSALSVSGAAAVCVTPAHQFPTGAVMPWSRRAALLDWAGEDKWIIEDDYDGDFRWQGRPLNALQSLDDRGRVVYMMTFSRTIAPGFRLAAAVLPPALLERYREKGDRACTVSRLEQATLGKFLSGGMYFRHLRRSAALYRKKQAALLEGLEPLGAVIGGAGAGLHITVTLPGRTESQLTSAAAAAGVAVTPLSRYRRDGADRSTVLLGFAGLTVPQLREAGKRLSEAWK